MMNDTIFSLPILNQDWFLGWLMEISIKSSLILLVAAALVILSRNRSAGVRYGVLATALTGALLAPLLSQAMPSWNLPLLPSPSPTSMVEERSTEPIVRAPNSSLAVKGLGREVRLDVDEIISASDMQAGYSGIVPVSTFDSGPSWTTIVLGAWLTGAALVLLRLVIGMANLIYMTRSAAVVTDPGMASFYRDFARKFGLRRNVKLLRSETLKAPLTWGWLRPVAMFPAASDHWSQERKRVVLLHELIHVRRYHWPIQILSSLTCILYWFNPLVWVVARQLELEREQACDEDVLAQGTRASDYATHLVEIARSLPARQVTAVAGVGMTRTPTLER